MGDVFLSFYLKKCHLLHHGKIQLAGTQNWYFFHFAKRARTWNPDVWCAKLKHNDFFNIFCSDFSIFRIEKNRFGYTVYNLSLVNCFPTFLSGSIPPKRWGFRGEQQFTLPPIPSYAIALKIHFSFTPFEFS